MFKFAALFALFAVASATNYAYQTVHTPAVSQYYTVPTVHQTVPATTYYQTPTVYQQTYPVASAKTYQYQHQTVHKPVVYQQQYQYQHVPVVAAKTYQTVPVASTHVQYPQVYTHTPAVVYSASKTAYKPVEQYGYQVAY